MTVLGSFPRRRKKNKKVDGKVYNNSDNNEGDKLLSVLRRRQIPTWQVTEFINSPFSCVLKNKLKCGYKYRRKYEFYFLLELWRENKLEFPTPASTIDLSNESEFLCKGIQFNFLFSTLIYLNIMRRGGYCYPASQPVQSKLDSWYLVRKSIFLLLVFIFPSHEQYQCLVQREKRFSFPLFYLPYSFVMMDDVAINTFLALLANSIFYLFAIFNISRCTSICLTKRMTWFLNVEIINCTALLYGMQTKALWSYEQARYLKLFSSIKKCLTWKYF